MKITNTEYLGIISLLNSRRNNMLILSWIMTATIILLITLRQIKETNAVLIFIFMGLALVSNIFFLRLDLQQQELKTEFKKQAKAGKDFETIMKDLKID